MKCACEADIGLNHCVHIAFKWRVSWMCVFIISRISIRSNGMEWTRSTQSFWLIQGFGLVDTKFGYPFVNKTVLNVANLFSHLGSRFWWWCYGLSIRIPVNWICLMESSMESIKWIKEWEKDEGSADDWTNGLDEGNQMDQMKWQTNNNNKFTL